MKILYVEDSDIGYIFEVDIEYPKNLHGMHSDLPFLLEKLEINKCSKLVCNFVHARTLKQALNHGLVIQKVHRAIKLNQKLWLKPYIEINTKLRTKAKNDFEKDFFKLMNNSVFRKTMENVRKHRDIKLVTTDKRRNELVSEPNYHPTKWF